MTGAPSIDELMAAVGELQPFSVFERMGAKVFLICDRELYASLLPRIQRRFRRRLIPEDRVSERTRWRIGAKRAVYFVLSLTSEAEQLRRLQEQHPAFVFKGFVADLLTAKSARVDPLAGFSEGVADPSRVYAVCCTARAGSTYLCELLGKSFENHLPYENFRPALIFLYRYRKQLNFDIRHWFDLTVHAQSVGGMFGTKVIGQFLSRMAPLIDEDDLVWLKTRITSLKPKLVYLVREDKVEQAVSQYVATELKFWHLREGRNAAANQERESEYRARKQEIAYDKDAIGKHYRSMIGAEHRLQGFIKELDLPVYRVTYDNLRMHPSDTMAGILAFLDMPGAQLPSDLSTSIQRGFDSKNAELVDRFKRDIAREAVSS